MPRKEPEHPATKRFVQEYPAAAAAVLTGLAALIVWLLGLAGIYDVPPTVAAAISGIVISAGLMLGKYGIKGIVRRLWKGANGK